MKALLMISLLLTSTAAQATVIPTSGVTNGARTVEILNQVAINGEITPYVGRVTIDHRVARAKVEIYRDMCGSLNPDPNVIRCMAVATLIDKFEAPIKNVSYSCGSKIYTAEENQIPDATQVKIEITDHSSRLCKDIVPSLMIVEAETYNPWTNKTTKYYLQK